MLGRAIAPLSDWLLQPCTIIIMLQLLQHQITNNVIKEEEYHSFCIVDMLPKPSPYMIMYTCFFRGAGRHKDRHSSLGLTHPSEGETTTSAEDYQ